MEKRTTKAKLGHYHKLQLLNVLAGTIYNRHVRIKAHLVQNLTIDPEDFDTLPIFTRAGGRNRAEKAFPGGLALLIS